MINKIKYYFWNFVMKEMLMAGSILGYRYARLKKKNATKKRESRENKAI